MVDDKAIINLLLQRVRAEFCRGTNIQAALELLRAMAKNNQLTNKSMTSIAPEQ